MNGSTKEAERRALASSHGTMSISTRILQSMRFVRKSVLCVDTGERRSPTDLARAAAAVVLLSRFYYLFIAYMVGTSSLGFSDAYVGGPPTAPLWPIKLLQRIVGVDWFGYENAITVAGLLLAISAAMVPRMLVWRLGTFLYLLVHVGLSNSYGSINHGTHVLLYISSGLLLLPRGVSNQRMTRASVLSCLTVLSLIQTMLLLPYTLSGFWKIWYGRLELLSPDSLTRIVLERALAEADSIPPLLPFIARYSLLAQAMWFVTLYIEIFALFVVFRPHLHRPFGVILMLFHITSDWLMNIAFSHHVLVLGLFLVLSPVAPARPSVSGLLKSLPIVGIPFRAVGRLQSADRRQGIDHVWLIYDGECPLCSNYARLLNLKQSVKSLSLIDARQGGPIVEEVRSLPHDLNTGMAVRMGNRYYLGPDALNVLALLSVNRGVFSTINRLVFNSPLVARLGYPWLKFGRWLLLKLKGVEPIGHKG